MVRYVVQKLDRTDAARVSLAGYPTEQSFNAFGAGGEIVIGARWDLSSRVSIGFDIEGNVIAANAGDSLKPYWGALAALAAGYRF